MQNRRKLLAYLIAIVRVIANNLNSVFGELSTLGADFIHSINCQGDDSNVIETHRSDGLSPDPKSRPLARRGLMRRAMARHASTACSFASAALVSTGSLTPQGKPPPQLTVVLATID